MSHVNLDIQYVTDKQGNRIFVQIPFTQRDLLRFGLSENEQIEDSTDSLELIDQRGVLVVRAT